MRRHLVYAMVVGAGLALIVVASALAKPHVIRAGNLFLKDDGGIFPSRLPRHSAPAGIVKVLRYIGPLRPKQLLERIRTLIIQSFRWLNDNVRLPARRATHLQALCSVPPT